MNKIKVVNDELVQISVNKNINIEYIKKECLFAINEIRVCINNSSDLEIEINIKEDTKLNFNIEVKEYVNFNLNILTTGNKGKIQYKYQIKENSNCNVFKFQNVNSIKEMVIIALDGENSNITYNFKTISNNKETYDYHIFHNYKNSVSNIKNNCVCINNGSIIYQVSSFVPKNIIGCNVNQNNRIINLTENECEIKPNLYIDCNDVSANHSALIGKFSDEEMFYIQSRGIDYDTALVLLIKGFLTSDINNKRIINNINKNILKYWR